MTGYSLALKRFLNGIPGKQRFGVYRFLPVFFVLGAALEFSMINWTVGETNFYRTFKKRQAKNYIEEKLHQLQPEVTATAATPNVTTQQETS